MWVNKKLLNYGSRVGHIWDICHILNLQPQNYYKSKVEKSGESLGINPTRLHMLGITPNFRGCQQFALLATDNSEPNLVHLCSQQSIKKYITIYMFIDM